MQTTRSSLDTARYRAITLAIVALRHLYAVHYARRAKIMHQKRDPCESQCPQLARLVRTLVPRDAPSEIEFSDRAFAIPEILSEGGREEETLALSSFGKIFIDLSGY